MLAKITAMPDVQCIAHWIANIATADVASTPMITPVYFILLKICFKFELFKDFF